VAMYVCVGSDEDIYTHGKGGWDGRGGGLRQGVGK
jgi:hypothetical protein